MKSGVNGGDVYKPTIYWYPLLKFLEQSTNADDSVSSLDTTEEIIADSQVEEYVSFLLYGISQFYQMYFSCHGTFPGPL